MTHSLRPLWRSLLRLNVPKIPTDSLVQRKLLRAAPLARLANEPGALAPLRASVLQARLRSDELTVDFEGGEKPTALPEPGVLRVFEPLLRSDAVTLDDKLALWALAARWPVSFAALLLRCV